MKSKPIQEKKIKAWAIIIEEEPENWVIPQSCTDETPPALDIFLKKGDAILKKGKGEVIIPCTITYKL